MICVEVHSNNVLTVRNDIFATAVSDSIKHETIKFLFSDNWKNYQKTAVFSAADVAPINILLKDTNEYCVSDDECYIPFEVLATDGFTLSVFGVDGEKRATTTRVQIGVLESGYELGDAPKEATQSEYSQMLDIMAQTEEIARSLRKDADSGLFKGDKGDRGEKGDKGDKGDTYTLTEQDRNDIASKVMTNEFARFVNQGLDTILDTQIELLGGAVE